MKISFRKTLRGFSIVDFSDRNGECCSIQKSSAIPTDEREGEMIWFGITNPDGNFKVLEPGHGWKKKSLKNMLGIRDFTVPDRMHLTQKMVKEILPVLQHFAETGDLPDE